MADRHESDVVVPIAVAPESLASARAAIAGVLPDWPDEAVYGAQLVAVELLTNAWLHGAPPVTLSLRVTPESVRIEVSDGSDNRPVQLTEVPNQPLLPPEDSGGMVGRGLTVIASLASSWGVTAGPAGGKSVYAVVPRTATIEPHDRDLGQLAEIPAPRAAIDASAGGPAIRVSFAAPTRLLLDVNSRVDDVMRELSLISAHPAEAGVDTDEPALSPALVRAVHAATHDWVYVRRAIHQQAAEAHQRGETFTQLTLDVPTTAAEQGRRFLEAVDRAEQLARVGRLLVTPESPSQRAFRHWSVSCLVQQVEAALAGLPCPPPTPFAELLSAELDRLGTLEEAWDRLQLLQRITAGLTVASSAQQAAEVVADNVAGYRGVLTARIYITAREPQTGEEVLRSVAYRGHTESPELYAVVPLASDVPGAVAVRTNTPVHRTRLAEIYQTFPDLKERGFYGSERSLHLLPMTVSDQPLGLVAVTFADASLAPSAQVDLVHVIADTLAQTLERIRAGEAAAEAAERLSLLADASIALSVSLELQPTVDAVLGVLVPRFADWAVVQILRDGQLATIGLQHRDPERRRWAFSMRDRWATDMSRDTGGPAIVRTGISELYPVIDSALVAATAVDDEHREALQTLGMASGLAVALIGRSGVIGVLTLIRSEQSARYREEDLPLVEDIARRAALAIETAETFREQSGRLANVMRVADAAQRAILTEPPSVLGPVALAARYVSAAAEARVGGDLYDVLALPDRVRLLIGDVRGKGLDAVRTATIVLGAFRAAATEVPDLAGALAQMDSRVRRFLGEEDFITAAMVDVYLDGRLQAASAGHPAPVLACRAGEGPGLVQEPLELSPSAPLGLGGRAQVVTRQLVPGDRILLYTDGLLEARRPDRTFVDMHSLLTPLTGPLPDGGLAAILDGVLERLHRATGARLGDDLALLALEYRGDGDLAE